VKEPGQQRDGDHGQAQDPQRLRQDARAENLHGHVRGQGRERHAVLAPHDFYDSSQDYGQPHGQKDEHQMIVRFGGPKAHALHDHGHHGHEADGQGQGRNSGQAQSEQGGEHEHPAQGDEVDLDEIDDAHGIADHTKAQRDKGVNGPAGQTAKNILQEICVQNCFQLLEM
jgi:hypothetical protein